MKNCHSIQVLLLTQSKHLERIVNIPYWMFLISFASENGFSIESEMTLNKDYNDESTAERLFKIKQELDEMNFAADSDLDSTLKESQKSLQILIAAELKRKTNQQSRADNISASATVFEDNSKDPSISNLPLHTDNYEKRLRQLELAAFGKEYSISHQKQEQQQQPAPFASIIKQLQDKFELMDEKYLDSIVKKLKLISNLSDKNKTIQHKTSLPEEEDEKTALKRVN